MLPIWNRTKTRTILKTRRLYLIHHRLAARILWYTQTFTVPLSFHRHMFYQKTITGISFTDVIFCCRPAAGDLFRASLLVLYSLLWAEPACGGDVPRLSALAHSGWLHRSIKLWAFLPRPAVECKQERHCGDDPETHRYGTDSLNFMVIYHLWTVP